MNNKLILLLTGAALAIVIVALGAWIILTRFSSTVAVTTQPKGNPPARDIPSVVVKNMDDAVAKRDGRLNGLNLPKPAIIYAKVVDQIGRPLPGAKAVIESALAVPSANQKIEQTSESDGTLSFSTKWRLLSVTVTKPGYHDLLASSSTFQYAKSAFVPPRNPDPDNPVVFILQKM